MCVQCASTKFLKTLRRHYGPTPSSAYTIHHGMWYVVCGMWYVVCGIWYVVCGMWYVVCGLWYTYHIPHTTYHIPHTTYHIPHTTYHIPYTTYHIPHTTYHIPYTTYHIPHTTYHIPHTMVYGMVYGVWSWPVMSCNACYLYYLLNYFLSTCIRMRSWLKKHLRNLLSSMRQKDNNFSFHILILL